MYNKRTEGGQDIFDMTLQEYGQIELLFVVLFDNVLEPTADLSTGQVLSFREQLPADIDLDFERLDYFRRNEIRVNTHSKEIVNTSEGDYWETSEGGWWGTSDGGFWQTSEE